MLYSAIDSSFLANHVTDKTKYSNSKTKISNGKTEKHN